MWEFNGWTYLEGLAVKALHPPDGAQGEGEAIAAGPTTMCLSGKCGGDGSTGRLDKAGSRGRETDVGLGEVQLASIVKAIVVLTAANHDIVDLHLESPGSLTSLAKPRPVAAGFERPKRNAPST